MRGGGIERGRARHQATTHLVADDPDRALDDLRRYWSAERRQTWAIDTGTTRKPLTAETDLAVPARLRASLRHARLQAERDALVAAIPTDPRPELAAAGARLRHAVEDRDDLLRGCGRWRDTPQGAIAAALREARAHRAQAETFARDPAMSRKMRRIWKADASMWATREVTAQRGWDRDVAPTLTRLDSSVGRLEEHQEQLRGAVRERDDWLARHPEAARRVRDLDAELARLSPASSSPTTTERPRSPGRLTRSDTTSPAGRTHQSSPSTRSTAASTSAAEPPGAISLPSSPRRMRRDHRYIRQYRPVRTP